MSSTIPSTAAKRSMTPLYSLMTCSYWMGFAVILGFASVFLLAKGYTNSQIGLILAVSGLVSAVLQPTLATYADKPTSIGVKKLVLICAGALLVTGLLLSAFSRSKIMCGLLFGIAIALLQLLQPLLNAWGIGTVSAGNKLNIGFARGFSSLFYDAASAIIGRLLEKSGVGLLPWLIFVFFLLLGLVAFFFPALHPAPSAEKTKSIGFFNFCKKYPAYAVTLLGCLLIFISHVFLNSFTFQITQAKGGGSTQMGIAMSLAAVLEVPVLMGFSFLQKKKDARFWFRLSGLFFLLKNLGTWLAPSMGVFYAVQVFQMGGWAVIAIASIYYINELMDPEDLVKGQAYYSMAYTIANLTASLLGGRLIDTLGVNAMLIVGTIAAAVGWVIVLIFTGRKKAE